LTQDVAMNAKKRKIFFIKFFWRSYLKLMGVVWGEHGLEDFCQNLYKFGGMVGLYRPVLFSKINNLGQLLDIVY